ncbi:hypothetical protein [Thermus sediminis]|uniref:hypothetical protein n=1 Tax=Thermus sediminis TaxID=1761908 RepID=UPI0013005558|nr:hypothetical protein [Thermus sediminis]
MVEGAGVKGAYAPENVEACHLACERYGRIFLAKRLRRARFCSDSCRAMAAKGRAGRG